MASSQDADVKLFGFNLSKMPKKLQFSFCTGGIFFFYLMYGYYQERIFLMPGFRPYGLYLTLIQFGFYATFAITEWFLLTKQIQRCIPYQTYCLLAFLTVGTMGMSNASVGFLNYPTQVIFKCCKLVPVMIGGIVIQGKKYTILDFFACVLMSVGLTLFILADSIVRPSFNLTGITMMMIALAADAAIGNVQEKIMRRSGASNTEVVLFSYGIGFWYIFVLLLLTGNLFSGFAFYMENPVEKYGYTMIFSLTGYLGISFVLALIRTFGAFITVTVTTCRKALTIIISFTIFSKPFTTQYIWSGLIVLAGIMINVYRKNQQKIDFEIYKYYDLLRRGLVVKKNKIVRDV